MDEQERQRRLVQYQHTMLGTIAEHGWMVQGVFPTDADPGGGFEFQYTVGLTLFGSPEFVVFGLPHTQGGWLLNEFGGRVKDGARFGPGDLVPGIAAADYLLLLLQVEGHPPELTQAYNLFGEQQVSALQVVYQDAERRWPWQEGYEYPQLPLLGPVPDEVKQAAEAAEGGRGGADQ